MLHKFILKNSTLKKVVDTDWRQEWSIKSSLRLIILPRPWLFWILQKANLIIVLLYIEWKKKSKSCFCFFTDSKQHKTHKVNLIIFRNHAPWSHIIWLPVSLTCLLYYYTLNSLSLFWLAKSVQWIFEISCRLYNNHVKDIQGHW